MRKWIWIGSALLIGLVFGCEIPGATEDHTGSLRIALPDTGGRGSGADVFRFWLKAVDPPGGEGFSEDGFYLFDEGKILTEMVLSESDSELLLEELPIQTPYLLFASMGTVSGGGLYLSSQATVDVPEVELAGGKTTEVRLDLRILHQADLPLLPEEGVPVPLIQQLPDAFDGFTPGAMRIILNETIYEDSGSLVWEFSPLSEFDGLPTGTVPGLRGVSAFHAVAADGYGQSQFYHYLDAASDPRVFDRGTGVTDLEATSLVDFLKDYHPEEVHFLDFWKMNGGSPITCSFLLGVRSDGFRGFYVVRENSLGPIHSAEAVSEDPEPLRDPVTCFRTGDDHSSLPDGGIFFLRGGVLQSFMVRDLVDRFEPLDFGTFPGLDDLTRTYRLDDSAGEALEFRHLTAGFDTIRTGNEIHLQQRIVLATERDLFYSKVEATNQTAPYAFSQERIFSVPRGTILDLADLAQEIEGVYSGGPRRAEIPYLACLSDEGLWVVRTADGASRFVGFPALPGSGPGAISTLVLRESVLYVAGDEGMVRVRCADLF